ncbi:DUF2975 domain-containing protein [Kitasatospora sp. RG8]|uniref:DUF2975 domain-containing protein n=1 Tax=Kitasatospora sp. RG8 TaxID=2820815 RepID=UPI001ADF0BC6|nr:DUF2975 domain-containing protein [Kitasatospora sp. RG8]MBP0450985.1 DUF2975 domain-containing protein [Kitasatospora sp. RG8]
MTLTERLRRADWLGEMQAALVLCLAGAGIAAALPVARAVLGDDHVVVRLEADPAAGPAAGLTGGAGGLPGGAAIAPESVVEAHITDPSLHQRIAELLTTLPTLLLLAGVLALLLRIVRRARRGDPFTAATVQGLRVLGLLTALGGSAAGAAESLAALDLSSTVTPGAAFAVWEVPAGWLLAGIGFLAVAEVLRRGVTMRDELAAVI